MNLRVIVALLVVLLPMSAQACAVCFGVPGSKDSEALGFAIAALLAVLAVVLGSIVTFIAYLARQARE